jgi:hypothetical protein
VSVIIVTRASSNIALTGQYIHRVLMRKME